MMNMIVNISLILLIYFTRIESNTIGRTSNIWVMIGIIVGIYRLDFIDSAPLINSVRIENIAMSSLVFDIAFFYVDYKIN